MDMMDDQRVDHLFVFRGLLLFLVHSLRGKTRLLENFSVNYRFLEHIFGTFEFSGPKRKKWWWKDKGEERFHLGCLSFCLGKGFRWKYFELWVINDGRPITNWMACGCGQWASQGKINWKILFLIRSFLLLRGEPANKICFLFCTKRLKLKGSLRQALCGKGVRLFADWRISWEWEWDLDLETSS